MSIVYGIAFLFLIALAIFECAKARFMVTFMERNWIAIREIGGTPIGLIGDPPPGQTIEGLKLREWTYTDQNGYEVVDVNRVQTKHVWEKLGLFVIGFPWHTLKIMEMIHERMSKDIDKITDPTKWMEREGTPRPTWYLECNPTHEFLIMDIELSEGWVINCLAQVELALIDPLIAGYERKGMFYPIIGQRIRAGLNDAIKGEDFRTYQKLEKDAESNLSRTLCRDINESLVAGTGYKARRILFPKWDPIDKQRELALQKQKAKIDAEAKEALASAENAEFKIAMEVALKDITNPTNEEISAVRRDVIDMLNKKRMASSQLTVYAEGGANMAISTPAPERKGGKK